MSKLNVLVAALLDWFKREARDLPWRRKHDPYAIWISEIMLQQTQVKTVIPYWERWMQRFPDVQTLADAHIDAVLKHWEGLGYYTRARNLHKAAQYIAQSGGQFPSQYEQVLELPGIGRYTAGAICSIAFNQPAPILDGNVVRVLTRVYGIADNARDPATTSKLWEHAEQWVNCAATSSNGRACSDLNQGLMELGALVCTPKQPQCSACPFETLCVARKKGLTSELPNLGARTTATQRQFVAFVVSDGNRFLIRQRPAGVVNAHLWEFPNVEIISGRPDLERTALDALNFTPKSLHRLCEIRHTITRYRIQLDVFLGEIAPNTAPDSARGSWHSLAELDKLAFPSAHRRIVEKLKSARTLQLSLPV